MGQSWLNAPPVRRIAASQGCDGWQAQFWAVTQDYQLIFTQGGATADDWTPWSQPDWDGAPLQMFDMAAAQQGDGRVQIFVLDNELQLWTAWQLEPGGAWSGFAGPNWNGAPKLRSLCVSEQGGGRGAQIFAVTDAGAIISADQATPGGSDWSQWYPFNGPVPAYGITASLQNDGRVQVYAVDTDLALWTTWQTAPGNGWATWAGPNWNSPPGRLKTLAAVQQGGQRGAQLWGADHDYALWTSYQAVPGADWSGWIGPSWAGAPAFSRLAGAQLSTGCVQFWGVDLESQLWTIVQTSPGGDWSGWSNT